MCLSYLFRPSGKTEIKEFTFDYSTVLGRGGFGIVVKGCRISDKKEVAVKILKPLKRDAYTENEWKIPETVNNPFLLKVLAQFELGDEIYVISELCNSDLAKVLQTKGKLSLSNVKVAACHLSRGYMALHTADIVHRDIKPANIFVEVTTQGAKLKLADFGCGKAVENIILTSLCGTPFYMAPEVYDEKYDFRADIWSLGLVLYECLFGSTNKEFFGRIFTHAKAKQKQLKLPTTNDESLDDLFKQMIQPDYEKRMCPQEFYSHRFHKDLPAKSLIIL